jgi:hypothetical protein
VKFHSSTTIAVIVTLLAGISGVVTLVSAHRTLAEIAEEKQSIANHIRQLTAERAGFDEQIARLKTAPVVASPVPPKAERELAATLVEIVAFRKTSPPPQSTWKPYPRSDKGDVFPSLLADPAYARQFAQYQGLTIEVQYADFFATTSASPESLVKLRHALEQRAIGALERDELITKHGVPDSQRGEVSHMLAKSFDAEARSILGDSAFAEFKRFEESQPARIAVMALAERLSYTEPLTSLQTNGLVEIMLTTIQPHGNRQVPTSKFNEAVLRRAQALFSPEQLEQMKNFQQERDAASRK